MRAEFCQNILESDYTLCPRGGGNWSYRFYETLCLGRVPVYFDTGAMLPYDFLINWQDYCVWISGDRIEETPGKILSHYKSHSPSTFRDLQRRCRELWQRYLSLNGFFEHFHLHTCFDLCREQRRAC